MPDSGCEKDCFFYEGVNDMNATIPACEYDHQLGWCPCKKDCPKYISREEATELIRQHVDRRP